MRRVGAAGAVLLVLLSLGGCSALFHQDDVAEEPLRERIGDLPIVDEIVTSVEAFGPEVWVYVNRLDGADLHRIVASADEVIAGRDVSFAIAFDEHRVLSIRFPHAFSAEELALEVDYWLALSAANEAPLGIILQSSRLGLYRNIWDPDALDVLDWDALRAVPDPSTADHTFDLGGIWADEAIPTPEVVALSDSLAAIDLGDEESLAVENSAPGYIQVRYRAPGAGETDPTALPSWPRLREVVTRVAAFRSPQSNFLFQGSDDWAPTASIYLGECEVIADGSIDEQSDALLAALTDSDIAFPLGASSGYCNDAAGLTADGRLTDS